VSLNNQDWHDVKDPTADSSYTYYASPHITQVDPNYGHVKATKSSTIKITGTGFSCFDNDCSDLKCRFGNTPSSYIYVNATLVSSEEISCDAPLYTKPDVLKVEATINGESYTSDNKTYGYFDPFVLDAVPRLISTDGKTIVDIKGIGFANTGEAKSLYRNKSNPILCGGSSTGCELAATFKDKHTLTTTTFA